MPILVRCPNPACGATAPAPDALAGRGVKCKKCGKPFVARPTLDGQASDTKKSRPSSAGEPFPALPAEFGRYRVLRLLGRGGMGAVYLAEDSQLGRQVALKLPSFDGAESPQRAERFVREARSAAALHHPNICTVFDAGRIDGRPFLTMAFIDGRPLEAEIDPDAPMPQQRAAEVARKVALALEHAHRKGTVHRDLKPANVMVAADGEPVVMDFGLAKRVAEGEGDVKLTRDGGVIGTPSYMSPEQVRGEASAIGPATDIYSLGVMLFEMLCGQTPYGGSMGVVMGQILAAPVPPVREFRPGVDGRLDAICQKAMAKDASERFASMAEFADALGRYLAAPTVCPPPLPARHSSAVSPIPFENVGDEPTVPSTPKKAVKGRSLVLAALALLVPLACGFAVVLFRMETAKGTLLVEMDDEAEARIKNGKLVLSGPDGKARYTLTPSERSKTLEAGLYTVRVEGADGLALDTSEFTLKKGDKVMVRVTAEPKAVVKNGPKPLPVESPPPKPPKPPDPGDVLKAGQVWVGNRTYTRGAYAGFTVPYELHIKTVDGTKFTGHQFDNGTGRNKCTVAGERTGKAIAWTEQSTFDAAMIYKATGSLNGTSLRATQVGRHGGRWTGDASVVLILADRPVTTARGVPYVFPPGKLPPPAKGKE